jgi:transcriptional regulator with XRE-family HTH domain
MVARADPVDAYVGSRIRVRRTLLGLSQEGLGKMLGLAFQQVQKYERGANRVSAGRLYLLSKALDVPVSYFFDGLPPGAAFALSSPSRKSTASVDGADAMSRRETLELIRAYYRIGNPKLRENIGALIKSIAGPKPGVKRRGRPPKGAGIVQAVDRS